MAKQTKQTTNPWAIAGLAFLGCVVIGSGIGQAVGHPGGWSSIGAGVGFLAMATLLIFLKNKN